MAHIIIVDTQAQLRDQLALLLERAGHRATAVATVSEATNLLQAEIPDLLATDVVLIDGSSTSLAQQGRSGRSKNSNDDGKLRSDRRV